MGRFQFSCAFLSFNLLSHDAHLTLEDGKEMKTKLHIGRPDFDQIFDNIKAKHPINSATQLPYEHKYPGFELQYIQNTLSPQGGKGVFVNGTIEPGTVVGRVIVIFKKKYSINFVEIQFFCEILFYLGTCY